MTNYTAKQFGKDFTKGVIDALMPYIISAIIVSFVFDLMRPTDDTDFSSTHRSGVEIVTDAKTGKQYLVSQYGGIVERNP